VSERSACGGNEKMTNEFEEKQRRAPAGSRIDQEQLGVDYFYGYGVEVDYKTAAYWFSLAAAQGAAWSMGQLATMYAEGLGVAADMAEAIRLYEKAAPLGAFHAQISLARIYRRGAGTPVNPAAAFRWYVAVISTAGDQKATNHHPSYMKEAKDYISSTPDCVSVLTNLLETDSDENLRVSAAITIGAMKLAAGIPALIRGLDDPSVKLRAYIAGALGLFDVLAHEADPYQDEVIQALTEAMDDPSEEVRGEATHSVIACYHNTPETRALLWRSLDDPDDDVRAAAAFGLARFEASGLGPRLDTLLRDDASLSAGYFAAAEILGDASLLPALRLARTRLRGALNEGETLGPEVDSAIQSLETAVRLGLAD
jgi:HEAT repeat protein